MENVHDCLQKMKNALARGEEEKAEVVAERYVAYVESLEFKYQSGGFLEVFERWARIARKQENVAKEIAILERCFRLTEGEQKSKFECDMLDSLLDARERERWKYPRIGTCTKCGKGRRKLSRLDDGLIVCLSCRKDMTPFVKVPSHDRYQCRAVGLEIRDPITEAELNVMRGIVLRRHLGLRDDAPDADVKDRLAPKPKVFFTKVHGVSHKNLDGTSRQDIIECCCVGETLRLIRESENPHNYFAVKVCRLDGDQIGYLGDNIVGCGMGIGWSVAEDLDAGSDSHVVIAAITGDKRPHGVNIHVTIGVPAEG